MLALSRIFNMKLDYLQKYVASKAVKYYNKRGKIMENHMVHKALKSNLKNCFLGNYHMACASLKSDLKNCSHFSSFLENFSGICLKTFSYGPGSLSVNNTLLVLSVINTLSNEENHNQESVLELLDLTNGNY